MKFKFDKILNKDRELDYAVNFATSFFVSASLGSDVTGDGSMEKPYAKISTALTAIDVAYAAASDKQTTTYILDVGSGIYADNLTIHTCKYLRIQGVGVTISGTILIDQAPIGGTGAESYTRLEFIGMDGARAEKGASFTISGDTTMQRTNDSLTYIDYKGCYVTGAIEADVDGIFVLQFINSRVSGAMTTGTFTDVDSAVLIESWDKSRFGAISGKTSFYNCDDTYFSGAIDTTPIFECKLTNCQFGSTVSIVATKNLSVDAVSYKALEARTPTLTGMTYVHLQGTMAIQDASAVTITGGTISGVTFTENFTTSDDPVLNAATSIANVDDYNGVLITLTGAGNDQTIQDPTDVAAIKYFTVINNDTSTDPINIISGSGTHILVIGQAETFAWDGSVWNQIDIGIDSIPVKPIQGGTGLATLTDHGILLGSGTDAVTPMTELATGEVVIGATGADAKSLAAQTVATKQYLNETGTGSAGQDPAWTRIDGVDVDIADAGSIITATEVEGALQENRTAIDLNTAHVSATGASHSFIDQSVVIGSAPSLLGTNITTELANDLTPQLGGDLDGQGNYSLNNQSIINLASNGAGYFFNGDDDYLSTSYRNIGLGSTMSISLCVSSNDITEDQFILYLGGSSNSDAGIYFRLQTTGSPFLAVVGNGSLRNTTAFSATAASVNVVNDKMFHVVVTADLNGYKKLYINGNYVEQIDISALSGTFSDNTGTYSIGASSSSLNGVLNDVKIYSNILTATEVKDLYSNANIPFKYEGASNTVLTTGSLVVGKEYIIDTFVAGDDFVNVGGTNVTGTVFTATGTSPTTWTNASSLRTQGNVADYNSSGVSDATWYDQSGNGNDGTVSGALVTGRPEERVVDTLRVDGAIIKALETPASAAAQGTVGQVVWDNGYIYICTATNTWKRVEIATW